MKQGVWCGWWWLLGLVLALACLSCRPSVAPVPRQAPPPPPAARQEAPPPRPTFYVKVGRLNLRAGPGMDFPKLGLLERNEEVEKLGEAENWYQIRVKRDGTLGWVSSEYLSSNPVTSPIETPVPEAPPTPTAKEKEKETPPPPTPAESKKPKPAKAEPTAPKEPKPAEAAEPPARRAKPVEEEAPPPPPAPKTVQEKPTPKKEEAPPPPPPASPPPEEKPSGIRIM